MFNFKTLTLAATLAAMTSVAAAQNKADMLAVALSKPQFSTLAKAVEAAGLTAALQSGDSKITLFAPTNDAFAKLPASDLEALLKPENKDKLVSILTHHVVAGDTRSANDLPRKRNLRSLQGSEIAIELERGRIRADGARVGRYFKASNGTLITIDSVMMPN